MQNRYNALKKNVYSLNNYTIVPLRLEDMQSIKIWRNGQVEVLRQKGQLTDKDQQNYFQNIVSPSFSKKSPRRYFLAT
jgi:hypothetical protein